MLEPISSTVEGEVARFSMKGVPIVPSQQVTSSRDSATESEGRSQNYDTEDDSHIRKQQKKGLRSAHKGGTVRKYSLWTRISFTCDVRLRGMTGKELQNG